MYEMIVALKTHPIVRFTPRVFFMVQSAVMQGVYVKLKTRKESAAAGVKILCMPSGINISVLETMVSLAKIPDKSAATSLPSPKPRGANRGANKFPKCASMLSFPEAATVKRMVKLPKKTITRDDRKTTVPARIKKSFIFI